MELKRSSGFDVVSGQLTYGAFLEWYRGIRDRLSSHLPDGQALESVFEVGCGSGANLFLFEGDGLRCGGIDYSPKLLACARQVLRSEDLHCREASALPAVPQYDALISNSVFGYFTDEVYAEEVLERMCRKARYAVGILDVADADKQAQYVAYRKVHIPDYETRYRGLPRLFLRKAFFQAFARSHDMDILITPVQLQNYWNHPFYYDCYLYKRAEQTIEGRNTHVPLTD